MSAVYTTSQVGVEEDESDNEVRSAELVMARLKNSSALANLIKSLSHITKDQRDDVLHLVM